MASIYCDLQFVAIINYSYVSHSTDIDTTHSLSTENDDYNTIIFKQRIEQNTKKIIAH